MALNKDGVTKTMATNVLGHVLMIDELLKQNKLQEGSSILFAGSETARGVPNMGQPAPKLSSGSVEEFKSIIDGTYFGEKDNTFEETYGVTKLVGILWMSSMARKLSNYRFISISPGMSSGTSFLETLPTFQKMVFSTFLPLMDCMGMSHPVDKGAARYVEMLMNHDLYHSGKFYGSKRGATGAIGDQAEICDVFSNTSYQDNANEALHMFL
jgi:NAD(P)-dependent dehydrogenase (short-subunit alcohol dehydrogenase family)